MQHAYSGRCQCGNITLTVGLSKPLTEFTARQCDCEFCTHHQLAWLSDNIGFIKTYFPKNGLNYLTQGSNLAEFLQCTQCHQVFAVRAVIKDTLYSAVNAYCLDTSDMKDSFDVCTVSPKSLNEEDKQIRWQQVWFKQSEFHEKLK